MREKKKKTEKQKIKTERERGTYQDSPETKRSSEFERILLIAGI